MTTTAELKAKFAELQSTLAAYGHATGVLFTDGETVAPKGSAALRGRTLAVLSGITYELQTGADTVALLGELRSRSDELDPVTRRAVSESLRSIERMARIPKDEYVAYQELVANAGSVWHEAKNTNNFELFRPYLEKIFDTNRRIYGYTDPDKAVYDAALNEYERGLDTARCDAFFGALREKIVPLMKKVAAKNTAPEPFSLRRYPIWKQRILSDKLMDMLLIDRNYCVIGETEHPFTANFSRHDVRITTHYYEDNVLSSMFSVVHEGGHALYELGMGEHLDFTCLAGGVSMGIHESQSRFYENIIGRSRAFSEIVVPEFKKIFPDETADMDADAFYRAICRSEPSLIRTEADELTYCLHVMVRYELERGILEGKYEVADLPRLWAEKMDEYLGVEVPDDTHGVLQDSHWSGGSIGYFPSYALGSAYGAQMLAKMGESFDVYGAVRSGDLSPINKWLGERIWQHGCMYDPVDLFERCCEAPFDPKYFTDYLEAKYTDLYNL